MKVADLIKDVDSISPALQILPQLMDLLRDDDATLDDIIQLIKLDASLSAQVLKISNSGYYGLTTGSLEAAVNRLGQREVYKIVAIVCGKDSLNKPVEQFAIDDGELWENSVATGIVMENLSKRLGEEPDIAYTIGLLHSVGKLVIDEKVEGGYGRVYEYEAQHGVSLMEAERKVLGFTHAELAGELLKKWNFPENIYSPVAHQYEPSKAEEHKAYAMMIYLANYLVAAIGMNYGKDAWAAFEQDEAIETLKLSEQDIQELAMETLQAVEDVKGSLLPNRQVTAPDF